MGEGTRRFRDPRGRAPCWSSRPRCSSACASDVGLLHDGSRSARAPALAAAGMLRWQHARGRRPSCRTRAGSRRDAARRAARLRQDQADQTTDLVVFDPARPAVPPEPAYGLNTEHNELGAGARIRRQALLRLGSPRRRRRLRPLTSRNGAKQVLAGPSRSSHATRPSTKSDPAPVPTTARTSSSCASTASGGPRQLRCAASLAPRRSARSGARVRGPGLAAQRPADRPRSGVCPGRRGTLVRAQAEERAAAALAREPVCGRLRRAAHRRRSVGHRRAARCRCHSRTASTSVSCNSTAARPRPTSGFLATATEV
jgi:hypothetical protein